VKENVPPGSKVPLSNVIPSLEVTVCAIPSLLFHVITVPFLIVVVAGNDIPVMVIVFPFVVSVVAFFDLEQELKNHVQELTTNIIAKCLTFIK
jgi:hypothetical protein